MEGYNCPIRYAGEYYDSETGEYYLRARYMDASTGRFLTEDTSLGESENPLSENLYTYCENDPIQYSDPTGHDSWFTNATSAQIEAYFHSSSGSEENNAIAQSYGFSNAAAMLGAYQMAEDINNNHSGSGVTVTPQQVNTAINQGSTTIYFAVNGSSSSVQAAAALAIANNVAVPYISGVTPQSPPPLLAQVASEFEEVINPVVSISPRIQEYMQKPLMAGNSANAKDFSFPYELNYNDPTYARKYHDLTVVLQKYLIDRGNYYGFSGIRYSGVLQWGKDISYAKFIEDGADSRDQLGYYGLRTRNAVKWFQKEVMHMQDPDGIVGPETWHAMGLPEPGSDRYNWMLSANGRGWDATNTAKNAFYQSPESSAALTWASLTLSGTVASSNGSVPTPTPHSAAEAAQYLAAQSQFVQGGIPVIYREQILALMKQHPNWRFEFVNTGINWNDFISNELGEKSLTQNTDWIKNYNFNQDNWYVAKQSVIEYFADPRNFLNEKNIFQFEKLSYDPKIHTKEGVSAILKGTFMGNDTYAEYFMEAAQQSNTSPYFLASKARLEMGSSGNPLSEGTVSGYDKFFNYYNIGAYPHDGRGSLTNGAIFAKRQGWNSRESAIIGGANNIAASFIKVGQDTMYTQKFDLANFSHQYVQNIEAACDESTKYYDGYKKANALESGFVFKIPYFNGMPSSPTKLP